MGSLRNFKRTDCVAPKDTLWENSKDRDRAREVISMVQDLEPSNPRLDVRTISFLMDGQFSDVAKARRNRIIGEYQGMILKVFHLPYEDFVLVRTEIAYQYRKMLQQWGPLRIKVKHNG